MQMMLAIETVMCLPQLIKNCKMHSILMVPALIPGTVLYPYNYENIEIREDTSTLQFQKEINIWFKKVYRLY